MLKHKHFGQLRPHKHTSYAGLFFVLLLGGIVLLGWSLAVSAAPPAVNPQSGSIGLTGTVNGPPPTTVPTVLVPQTGTVIYSTPITISGTCPTGTFVQVTRNGVFGGNTVCQDDGTYSLLVDLFDGKNVLVARVSDALGQLGPETLGVTVIYHAPSLALPGGSEGRQLFLQSDSSIVAGSPGVALQRAVTIVGGVGPYAVSWDWGDNGTSLQSMASEGSASSSHSYERPGTYRVVVRVTDSLGNSAYMEMVTVVNGPVTTVGASRGNGLGAISGDLLAAWPLYILAAVMVVFFWLGERRELRKLRRRHQLVS